MYGRGAVVSLPNSRWSEIDFVIVDDRYVRGGRGTEYKLAPLDQMRGSAYGVTVRGSDHFGKPHHRHSSAEINKAISAYEATVANINMKKRERVEEGRKRIGDWLPSSHPRTRPGDPEGRRFENIEVGDKVRIGFNWFTVARINRRAGRIGLARSPAELARAQHRAHMMRMYGRRGMVRTADWISPTEVDEVKKMSGETGEYEERPLPDKLNKFLPRIRREIAKKKWSQLLFGSEFIESSYAMAASPRYLMRGRGPTLYDSAGPIYYDRRKKLYWRDTGFFD
jgi:hypothetical protein